MSRNRLVLTPSAVDPGECSQSVFDFARFVPALVELGIESQTGLQ